MKGVLGIDTSAYTTSLALVNANGDVVLDKRLVLKVDQGKRGLRQSEAVFCHLKNLPVLFEESRELLAGFEIEAVGASVTPRPRDDSYMPVFVPGSAWARSLAAALSKPFMGVSHQEGHIRAALVGTDLDTSQPFLAVHFSGGTSEVLEARARGIGAFDIDLAAATTDLAAGQLVDRVGVKLGLSFPSGPALERLALKAESSGASLPSAVTGDRFSFSGVEAMAFRLLDEGADPAAVAFGVLRSIANTLEKVIRTQCERRNVEQVLLAGGVMANSLIKDRLLARLDGAGLNLYFARPELATDNAVGVALLTYDKTSRR